MREWIRPACPGWWSDGCYFSAYPFRRYTFPTTIERLNAYKHLLDDARAAVRICKYPPKGCRSMTGTQPVFGLRAMPVDQTIKICNESTSTVVAMIESMDAIDAVDSIAAVEDVDVLLVGSSDLSIDLGVAGQFRSETYRSALEKVSQACQSHGKVLGVAGVYNQPDVHEWVINTLGARFMLVTQDASLIAEGGPKAIQALPAVKTYEQAT